MKPEIAAYFNDQVYQGGLTYNGHPISLAAAIAVIETMRTDHIVEHAKEMGVILADLLAELVERHPSVGEVRSIGLFGAIELVRNRKTKEPMAAYNRSSLEMDRLKAFFLDQGLFIYTHWHTLLIIPPLIINQAQLSDGIELIDRGLLETDKAVEG